MIETTLAEFQRRRHIVHRSGVVPALLKQAGCCAQDFLPGINQSVASHRVPW
jgi:hypothetical protein